MWKPWCVLGSWQSNVLSLKGFFFFFLSFAGTLLKKKGGFSQDIFSQSVRSGISRYSHQSWCWIFKLLSFESVVLNLPFKKTLTKASFNTLKQLKVKYRAYNCKTSLSVLYFAFPLTFLRLLWPQTPWPHCLATALVCVLFPLTGVW